MTDNNPMLQLDNLPIIQRHPSMSRIQMRINPRMLLQDLAFGVLLEFRELRARRRHYALGGHGGVAPESFNGVRLAVSWHFGVGVGARMVIGELDGHCVRMMRRRRVMRRRRRRSLSS